MTKGGQRIVGLTLGIFLVSVMGSCSPSRETGSSPTAPSTLAESSPMTSTTMSLPTATTTTTTTTIAPVPTTVAVKPLPDENLFDAAVTLHTLDAGSRDVSVAVMYAGRIIHTYAASSTKSSRAVDDLTNFRIASISKIVTATTVMALIDSGKLSIDEPIVGRIVDSIGVTVFDERARGITVRQLLSHTSGISNFLKIFFDRGSYDQLGMLREVLGGTLATEPGSTYKYSNVNYVLLGKAIELVTGIDYAEAVRQLVLEPLGLTSFRMVGTYEFGPHDALHAVSGSRTYMEQLGAAGAWVATASDVARLLDSLDPDSPAIHILTKQSMDAMKSPATPNRPDPLWDYGWGLRLFVSGEWGHSGSIENVHAMVVHRPDGLVVSVLVNGTQPRETDDLIGVINDAVLAARTGVPATTTLAP